MADETLYAQRRALARNMAFVFVLVWGLFIFFAGPAGAGRAANASPPTPTSVQSAVRIEWFSHCDPNQPLLGMYLPSDGACTPSRTAPLSWLQGQLVSAGMLANGEYLERIAHPTRAECGAAVFEATGQHSGWVCLDGAGAYRTDALGEGVLARRRLLVDGRWVVVS